MNDLFPEPLEQYWYCEVAKDEDMQDLLIVSDIAIVLQACGYLKSLAEAKALEIFLTFVDSREKESCGYPQEGSK